MAICRDVKHPNPQGFSVFKREGRWLRNEEEGSCPTSSLTYIDHFLFSLFKISPYSSVSSIVILSELRSLDRAPKRGEKKKNQGKKKKKNPTFTSPNPSFPSPSTPAYMRKKTQREEIVLQARKDTRLKRTPWDTCSFG